MAENDDTQQAAIELLEESEPGISSATFVSDQGETAARIKIGDDPEDHLRNISTYIAWLEGRVDEDMETLAKAIFEGTNVEEGVYLERENSGE